MGQICELLFGPKSLVIFCVTLVTAVTRLNWTGDNI
jgi:hypothetical protein